MNGPVHPPAPASPVVVITGAAGGLGQALVLAFSGHGARVVAGWHHHPAPWPAGVEAVPLDVTRAASVETALAGILARHGRIDVLVNNAGIIADQPLARLSAADWDRVLDVNLRGAFLCSRAVLGPMLRQRDGHIINVASFGARSGPAGQANYAAAKAGVIGLTQSLAAETGRRNVRVNAVFPGVLPTAMTAALAPAVMEALTTANVLGRINDPEEVARFLVFLSTTRNISGQVFQLDSRVAPWT